MTNAITVKRIGGHRLELPQRHSEGAAGFDLNSIATVAIAPGERALIPTGFAWVIPEGFCGQIWPRSGLAVRNGIDVGAGLIDSDYRGEVKVLLFNHSDAHANITIGDRIAQLVVIPIAFNTTDSRRPTLVNELESTVRGVGGFGSTGV